PEGFPTTAKRLFYDELGEEFPGKSRASHSKRQRSIRGSEFWSAGPMTPRGRVRLCRTLDFPSNGEETTHA
ncbi:MAG: hypothetical protein ACI8QS_002982, partial [Planctomycetota bacterium]